MLKYVRTNSAKFSSNSCAAQISNNYSILFYWIEHSIQRHRKLIETIYIKFKSSHQKSGKNCFYPEKTEIRIFGFAVKFWKVAFLKWSVDAPLGA